MSLNYQYMVCKLYLHYIHQLLYQFLNYLRNIGLHIMVEFI